MVDVASNSTTDGPSKLICMLFKCSMLSKHLRCVLSRFINEHNLSTAAFDTGKQNKSSARSNIFVYFDEQTFVANMFVNQLYLNT